MNYSLQTILKASGNIQVALLRFKDKGEQQNLHIRVVSDGDNLIHCIIDDGMPRGLKTGDGIHFIQRKNDDYFFISGNVIKKAMNSPGVLSISVTRAFWFERKSRGGIAWLREKYRYEHIQLAF